MNGMAEDASLDSIRANLAAFFENNPEARPESRPDGPVIAHPWDDPTVEVLLAEDVPELTDCLNSVRLPPRFSAIVHLDSNDVEFMYTAFPVDDEIRNRSFEFRFCGASFACRYGDASRRLLAIAKAFRPAGPPTETVYRNLRDVSIYFRLLKMSVGQEPEVRP